MSKIIALTGPSGVGKNTIAEAITKQLENFVHIDADYVKHMNPNAFTKIIDADGGENWEYSAWGLLGENIALLTKNFMEHGYDVIINGWVEVETWVEIEKLIKINHRILLLPEIDVNIARDAGRPEQMRMGEKAIHRGHDYFTSNKYFESFTKIDTSNDAVEETTARIVEIIN